VGAAAARRTPAHPSAEEASVDDAGGQELVGGGRGRSRRSLVRGRRGAAREEGPPAWWCYGPEQVEAGRGRDCQSVGEPR
jgi:hypothetical protein